MAGGGPKATPGGPPAGLGPRTGGATAAGRFVVENDVEPAAKLLGAAAGRSRGGGRRAASMELTWLAAGCGRRT
jgi:hypothetical protein